MKAQIRKGGKIFEGKLAEIFVKKGIGKEVKPRIAKTEQKEPEKVENAHVKVVAKPNQTQKKPVK